MIAQQDPDRSLSALRQTSGASGDSGGVAARLVSMLMDVSSEMIHAALPLYLVVGLGASALAVGVIEVSPRRPP